MGSQVCMLILLVTEQLYLYDNNLTGSLDVFCRIDLEMFAANTCEQPDEINCTCCNVCCDPPPSMNCYEYFAPVAAPVVAPLTAPVTAPVAALVTPVAAPIQLTRQRTL